MTATRTAEPAASDAGQDVVTVHLPKTSESEQLLRIRHSMSHVMAMAVQRLFPKAQVTIGPWTENGFYYDFDNPDPFTEALELPLNPTQEQARPLVAVVVGVDDVAAVARHPTGELPHKPRLIRANHLKDGGGSRHGMASKPVEL